MGESESEDSDAEGGLGNVSRVVMRPPGHSGKAKKGHLCFDASFETGNLGKVELVSNFEYDLFIRPDTCNPCHRMWFNFVVDNTKVDQRVLLHVVNISKHRNLYCDGMTPIVRSTSRKKWYRMPSSQVYFYKSSYHRNHYVLTLAFCFDKEEEAYQFAYSYPYSYSKCQAYLEQVERKMLPHFQRGELTHSLEVYARIAFQNFLLILIDKQERRIDVVSITNPFKSAIDGERKIRTVLIFSRLHPGDSPSSFICQGIMDFLISNHPLAERLRNQVLFKIIPMINVDGVVLGNFRSNLLGADFNRRWNRVSQYLHPPVHAIIRLVNEIREDKDMELDFVIDLRAHCSLPGVFVHGNSFEDVYRHERHTLFPKLLSRNIDGYENDYCMFNRDIRRKGSCKRYFSTLKDTINCYSLYASFYGYVHKTSKKFVSFNEEAYHRIGRNIVRTFFDYYSYVGVISMSPKDNLKSAARSTKGKTRRRNTFFRKKNSEFHKQRLRRLRRRLITKKRVITADEYEPTRYRISKNYIDFSDVELPALVERKHTLKRKFLTNGRKNESDRSTKNSLHELNTGLTILNIGG